MPLRLMIIVQSTGLIWWKKRTGPQENMMAREVVQWLSALHALAEDLSSIPSTYTVAHRASDTLVWHLTGTRCTDIHAYKTLIHIRINK